MKAVTPLTEEEKFRCAEVAELFSNQTELWPIYVGLVADLVGIDFDFEMSSKPASSYMNFVGNDVALWLRKNSPDVTIGTRLFAIFHELIDSKARLEIER